MPILLQGEQRRPLARLRRFQFFTLAFLVAGYSGYYLCRSNLSVALPLIVNELASRGIPAAEAIVRMGTIASVGVLAYAIGKFAAGPLAEVVGGRRMFLAGMIGSSICTVLFAAGGGLPIFTAAWIGNRAVQSLGWAGIVRITSRWFSSSSYGTVMGVISLSFLFGDAAARQFMGTLIGIGVGWRGVFLSGAAILFAIAIVGVLFLRESPGDVGEPEPPATGTLMEESGSVWRTLLLRPSFWLVCLISVGFTLIRETFNLWTPTYFSQVAGMSSAAAAHASALFPLSGGISVLIAGYVSDRLGKGARSAIIAGGLVSTSVVLAVMGNGTNSPVALTALVAFLMIGPYSYLAGAIALDLGGKRGSATASGWIDGAGYLGGILAGDSMARIGTAFGWRGAFWTLSAVSAAVSIAAAAYWRSETRK
jgi:OPA family glycerol-3-phosphate transporter-like MFS transporter